MITLFCDRCDHAFHTLDIRQPTCPYCTIRRVK